MPKIQALVRALELEPEPARALMDLQEALINLGNRAKWTNPGNRAQMRKRASPNQAERLVKTAWRLTTNPKDAFQEINRKSKNAPLMIPPV